MNRLLLCLGMFFFMGTLAAQTRAEKNRTRGSRFYVKARITDEFKVAKSDDLIYSGYIGRRLDSCIKNSISSADVEQLVKPFRSRTETSLWQTEFWGKWFTAAVKAYRYSHDKMLKVKIDKAVKLLIETQAADGYIGNYKQTNHLENWDIWGRKYCLLGLLSYADLTGDTLSVFAAKKLADHMIGELNVSGKGISLWGNHRGMAASSVLEPIVLLYKKTGEERYLRFANYIVGDWESGHGPELISKALAGVPVGERFPKPKIWWGWENGQKAYEMMSCYEGLLELYRVTGKKEYLLAVENTVSSIRNAEIMLVGSGSSVESWCNGKALQSFPVKHTMETCVTATWMKLCFQLLKLTGSQVYAEDIERSFYNALSGSMTPSGNSWSKYSELNGMRSFGEMQCGMNLNCCMASGPRGMMVIPEMGVMQSRDGVVINLLSGFTSRIALGGKSFVTIKQLTEYPKSLESRIEVNPSVKKKAFSLKIRIPEWCKNAKVSINGVQQSAATSGQYYTISRTWSPGDVVLLRYDLHAKYVEPAGSPDFYAILYGPLVLTSDARFTDDRFNNYLFPKLDKYNHPQLTLLSDNEGVYFSCSIPFLSGPEQSDVIPLKLIDYASAGNTWSKESGYKVWWRKLYDPSR